MPSCALRGRGDECAAPWDICRERAILSGGGAVPRPFYDRGPMDPELARSAASGVVENLRPIDSVGVLIFDNTYEWAVPIRKATDRAQIKRLIAGIQPEGGTPIGGDPVG